MTGPILTSGSIYSSNYCIEFTGDSCVQWLSLQSFDKNDIKELGVSILWNSYVFMAIILVIFRVFRILFGKFFGGRQKRSF